MKKKDLKNQVKELRCILRGQDKFENWTARVQTGITRLIEELKRPSGELEKVLGDKKELEKKLEQANKKAKQAQDNLNADTKCLRSEIEKLRKRLPETSRAIRDQRQVDVGIWNSEVFGRECAANLHEKAYRFLEEAAELAQACGLNVDQCASVLKYAFRDKTKDKDCEYVNGGLFMPSIAIGFDSGKNGGQMAVDHTSREQIAGEIGDCLTTLFALAQTQQISIDTVETQACMRLEQVDRIKLRFKHWQKTQAGVTAVKCEECLPAGTDFIAWTRSVLHILSAPKFPTSPWLPDWNWQDCYSKGMTPTEAIKNFRKESEEKSRQFPTGLPKKKAEAPKNESPRGRAQATTVSIVK